MTELKEKSNSSSSENKKEECKDDDHDWDIPDSEKKYTASEKIEKLDKSNDLGKKFEAKAAIHNKVKKGDCLSGPNKQSQLKAVCKKCGKKANTEIDHVTRDENGKITSITEVKHGNCNIKMSQRKTQLMVANKLGVPLNYKLEKGKGADIAEKLLNSGDNIPAKILKL